MTTACSFDPKPKPEVSLLALHLSKAGIIGKSLPAVFEDSDDDHAQQQQTQQMEQKQHIQMPLKRTPTELSSSADSDQQQQQEDTHEIADEPHLSFIISKPAPSTSKSNIACSAPNKSSTKMPTNLTLSSSLPCVNEASTSTNKEPSQRKNSKPPSVWCHKLNNEEMDQHFKKSEPNMLYTLLRSFSVSSMPALSASASTAATTTVPSTPINTAHRRKSSSGSLSLPLSSSLTLPRSAFSPIKLISDKLSITPTKPSQLTHTTKANESILVDTTNVTAQMINYDAEVERKRMGEDKTVWRRLGEYFVDDGYDTAERLNHQILQEERYPDTLSERLRNVKARWSLSISEARSEGRVQAVQLLKESRALYRESNLNINSNAMTSQQMQSHLTRQNKGRTPRCDHCFTLHWGGPYECELNQQIRAGRAYEREKRRKKSWIELHLTALKLNVGNWDKIGCPHPISHIKNFEYGADLCNSNIMSTKSWLEIQGDSDRERKESFLESREFDFCLKYLGQYHSNLQKKYVSVSSKRPRSSI